MWSQPSFRTKYEEDKYWDLLRKRCHQGYNGLTGRHYAYLNIGTIKLVTGNQIRPIWRDGDDLVFHEDEESRKYNEDLAIIKRREFGLTSIYGGFEPIYNCLFNPGSINLLTSADKTRVRSMFSDKTMVMFDGLPIPDDMKPNKRFERIDGFLNLSPVEGASGAGSQVWCVETASSDSAAKNVESFRAMSIFLDELFLHPRASQVLASSQSCVMQNFVKKGHIVLGGSCGAETDEEATIMRDNAKMVESLLTSAQHLGIRTVFLPGTLCIAEAPEFDDDGKPNGKIISFMENGYSDQEKAKEWILKKRSILEKAEDKKFFYNFVKNYPLTIEEVLEINKMGVLSPEIYSSLNFAKKAAHQEGENKRYYLRRVPENNDIIATENPKGPYVIINKPVPNRTYISGTDPIPFGDNSLDDGSDYAIVIKSREDERYEAYYAERNLDSDVVIDIAILLQEYYKSTMFPKGAPTEMEANRGEVAMRIYKERGYSDLLADRPKNLGIIYEDKKSKKGWFNNDKTGSRANNYLIQFLKKHAANQRLIRLIEECFMFPKGNTDVVDAVKGCELLDAELTASENKKYKSVSKYRMIPYMTRENGRVVQKWKKVEIE